MTDRPAEQIEAKSAVLLKDLGLTEYEAYTFLHLIRLGTGTASDVAELNDVPRTRVYDAVESLHDMGLVDIQYSTPRKFTPVSRETALRKLELSQDNTIEQLAELLDDLEPAEQRPEEFGVWTVGDSEAVASRIIEFIEDADEEIIYMTVDEMLTEDHLDALADAEDRGVSIHFAGISESVQERMRQRVPSAELFETLWQWSEAGAGSLLITDQRTALVSVLVNEDSSGDVEEVAIWGTGERNSLVVVLRTIFTWRLENHDLAADENTHRNASGA